MKKLFVVLILVFMAAIPWGCGNNNASNPAAPASSSKPAYTYPFLLAFGSFGSGNGQFNGPGGIAVDSVRKFIYVIDSINARLEKFDTDGNYLSQTSCSSCLGTVFSQPYGVGLDPAGSIYVADSNNDRVVKLDPNLNFVNRWGTVANGTGAGQFNGPEDVAVDANFNIYVTDNLNDRIQKFDGSSWTFLGGITSGTNPGQFDQPIGITVDPSGNYVYVSDFGNHRVQKIRTDLTSPTILPDPPAGSGPYYPFGLSFDPDGNLLVVDSGNARVLKLDSAGHYLTGFGTHGTIPGKLDQPHMLAIDSSGNVYITDNGAGTNGQSVSKFAPY